MGSYGTSRHVENLQALPAGARPLIAPQPEGLAAGKALGLLRKRSGGGVGPVENRGGVRERPAGAAAVRSAHDDQGVGVRDCVGVYSARKIQQRLSEDVAFRVLAAGNAPDFRTIADFRKIHRETLKGLFEQVLKMALELGAVKLGRVALDGSKVKANAWKHQAMSYARMVEQEKAIRQQVKEMLTQAEAVDAEEDARYGKECAGNELPEELQRRETRRKRIREAKRALEERARAKAKKEGQPVEKAQPKAKAQYNFTDPESRMMKSSSEGFVQAYNAQIVVEPEMQLIVRQAVTQAANDKEQVAPMMAAVEAQSGQRPEAVLADSGCCSEKNLEGLASEQQPERRIEAFIATERQKHEERRECGPGPLTQGATGEGRAERKMLTKASAG